MRSESGSGTRAPRLRTLLAAGPLDPEFKVSPRASADPPEGGHLLQTVFGNDLECFKAQSPWVWAERNAAAVRGRTRIRHVVGDRDEIFALNRDFNAHLTRLQIPTTFTALPGIAHDPSAPLDALGEANLGLLPRRVRCQGVPPVT